jgi:putative tricarboxylic transport membrane protein
MRYRLPLAVLVSLSISAAGCAAQGGPGAASGKFTPRSVDLVVHTGPGGGSDLFARKVNEILRQAKLVSGNWTVRNENGGSGATAMAYMRGLSGREDTVAFTTPTWLTTPLTNKEVAVTIDQMTPVVQLASEPTVMAVRTDSPYASLPDFVAAAKRQPGKLVQTGGSVTAVDAIAGKILQGQTGAQWSFLSFEGGGERIAALLGGDADMMFAAPAEIKEQVRSGALKVIATIGDKKSALFPDAPTLAEAGIAAQVPQQLRGVVGPPKMPQEAVEYYTGVFAKLVRTPQWATYVQDNGLETAYAGTGAWAETLQSQNDLLRGTLQRLGLAEG